MWFAASGAEGSTIGSGSLLGFGSGGSFPIWLFILTFIFGISIGCGSGGSFSIPHLLQALFVIGNAQMSLKYNSVGQKIIKTEDLTKSPHQLWFYNFIFLAYFLHLFFVQHLFGWTFSKVYFLPRQIFFVGQV